MAYIDQVDFHEAERALKKQYEAAVSRAGRVYGIIKVMSQTPQVLADSMRFYLTLMKRDGPLPKWKREMLATVVSRANGCVY